MSESKAAAGSRSAGTITVDFSDPVRVTQFVEADCGADAWAVNGGVLVAMRDNGDGTYSVRKRYRIMKARVEA